MADYNPGPTYFPLGLLAGLVVGLIIGAALVRSQIPEGPLSHLTNRAETIKHHAAHYEVNPTTGETTFRWNDETTK